MNGTDSQVRYRVEGMDCAGCATKIETALARVPGITGIRVSVPTATLAFEPSADTDLGSVEKMVATLGYTLSRADRVPLKGQTDEHSHADASAEQSHSHIHEVASGPWWKSRKGMLTLASGAGLVLAFVTGHLVPSIEPWAFGAAMLIGLTPIARRAASAALSGTPFSIEMLMTIAAVGAVIIGATEEAATVVFLFLVGELLEGVAASKARSSIQSLTKLVPQTALIEESGKTSEVPAESLKVGSIILVRPGDRIAADGVISDGESTIDEAPVTGESVPIRKGVEAKVYAGTVNGDGVLRVRVIAAAADNTIARVVKLVEEAQESKAPTERFIDRFSRYYTPGVVAVATIVAVAPPLLAGGSWSAWVYKGLAILLIGCPCALVISTPAAIAASLSAGARRGLLLKGGAVLEMLGKVTAVAFDKTGTLTEGKPRVTDVVAFDNSEQEILKISAALEGGSSHPLAMAILERAAADKLDVPQATEAKAIGGKGVSGRVGNKDIFLGSPEAATERVELSQAQQTQISELNASGKSVAVLVVDGAIAGAIALRDEPRADAKAGLKALQEAGIKTLMLTGDNRKTAEAIGEQLGLEVHAQLLPENKLRIVKELKNKGLTVAKVGDGINDAPALAEADVGIAMGGGTDVALETADAAVLHGRVGDVAAMIDLSKRTMRNIHQNITISLGLKAVFLVTTIIGVTGLWPAILADTGATVLVTANAMRLLRGRK